MGFNVVPTYESALELMELVKLLRPQATSFPLDTQLQAWRPLELSGFYQGAVGGGFDDVITYTVPDNCAAVLIHTFIHSQPEAKDPDLGNAPINSGDFRSLSSITPYGTATTPTLVQFVGVNTVNWTAEIVSLGVQGQQHMLIIPAGGTFKLSINSQLVGAEGPLTIEALIFGWLVPQQIGSVLSSINTEWFSVAVIGAALVIIGSMRVLDVANPSAPTLAATVAISAVPGGDQALWAEDHIAYALGGLGSDASNQLSIVDFTSRMSPVIRSQIQKDRAGNESYYNLQVHRGSDTLWIIRQNIGNSPNLLEAVDISNLSAPASVATYNMSTGFAVSQANPSGGLVRGDTLWVGSVQNNASNGKLGAYNIANRLAVTQTGVTSLISGAVTDITFTLADVIGTNAYVLVRSAALGVFQLRIYDITNPAAITLTGSVTLNSQVTQLSNVDASHLYGITSNPANTNIYAISVANPAAPAIVSTTAVAGIDSNVSLRAANRKLYLAIQIGIISDFRFRVFDVSNPVTPVVEGTVQYNPVGARSLLAYDM